MQPRSKGTIAALLLLVFLNTHTHLIADMSPLCRVGYPSSFPDDGHALRSRAVQCFGWVGFRGGGEVGHEAEGRSFAPQRLHAGCSGGNRDLIKRVEKGPHAFDGGVEVREAQKSS